MTHDAATARARTLVKSFHEGDARGEVTSFRDTLADNFAPLVPPQRPWGGTRARKLTSPEGSIR